MKRLNYFTLMIILIVGLAGTIYAEQIKVWGSTTCQKRFLEPGAEALKDATGIDVKVLGVGTGKGMMALFEGKAFVAAASATLESAIKSAKKVAKKTGKNAVVPDNLQFHEITKDVIVPIVHKDNPVTSLTWEQLKDINTGKIKNWKEIGGFDMPIRVITSHAGSSTKAVFQKMVMKKNDYVSKCVQVKSTRLEIKEVSKYKGAIGAVSEGFFKQNPGDTKVVQTDVIARPLGLITVGDPNPEVAKMISFFKSEDGKKYIK